MTTGEKIRAARKSKGMTLSELARAIGVTASAISQYERGKLIPSTTTVLCISDVLSLPMSEFLSPSELADLNYKSTASKFGLKSLMNDPCFGLNFSNETSRVSAQKGLYHATILQRALLTPPDDSFKIFECEDRTTFDMPIEEVSALCTLYSNLTDEGKTRVLHHMADLLHAPKYRRNTIDTAMFNTNDSERNDSDRDM